MLKYSFFATLILILISKTNLLGQLPNSGFESWTNGIPDGWWANNLPGLISPIFQSSEAHSGNYSVRGEVLDFMGSNAGPVFSVSTNGFGAPISQRYKTHSGWYKFMPVEGDIIVVKVNLMKDETPVAWADLEISEATTAYKKYSIDFIYLTDDQPNKVALTYAIGNKSSSDFHKGSYFLIDDVSLEGSATAVNNSNNILQGLFSLGQNYPNPFNPTTKIKFTIPEKNNVRLNVYNLLGQKVKELQNQIMEAGNYEVSFNAEGLTSGVYIYKIQSGKFSDTKKMFLIK